MEMNRLEQRTHYYTAYLASQGVRIEAEDVYGMLALVTCESELAYSAQIEHSASLDTYTERACENEINKVLRKELRRREVERSLNWLDHPVPDTTQVRLKFSEVLERLTSEDLLLLKELIEPSDKVRAAAAAYESRGTIRQREIGRTADAVAAVYGLDRREVGDRMKQVIKVVTRAMA